MNGWTVAWIFWILMFFAIEIPALRDKNPGDTLTEHLRSWFSTKNMSKGWIFRRAILVVFLLWFAIHLFFQGA